MHGGELLGTVLDDQAIERGLHRLAKQAQAGFALAYTRMRFFLQEPG